MWYCTAKMRVSGWAISLVCCTFLLLCWEGASEGISVELLDENERVLLKSALQALDPLVTERKRLGSAPLMTFEELYPFLDSRQKAFLDEIRGADTGKLGGSSRKLPPPSPDTEFVRLDNQMVVKDDQPVRLDAQYLPIPVYEAYRRMMAAMEADLGRRLLVESGYRSPAYQLYLFLCYMPKHGYSIRETNRFVALPGYSEHGSPARQAIDFITPEGINGEDRPEEFEELQEYGWLQARAHEFGFHLSYPREPKGSGRPGTFTAAFEPWHWHWEKWGGPKMAQQIAGYLKEIAQAGG